MPSMRKELSLQVSLALPLCTVSCEILTVVATHESDAICTSQVLQQSMHILLCQSMLNNLHQHDLGIALLATGLRCVQLLTQGHEQMPGHLLIHG
jgi:hypothetical protein